MKEKSYNDVSDGLDDFLSQSLDLIGGLERLVDQVFGLGRYFYFVIGVLSKKNRANSKNQQKC